MNLFGARAKAERIVAELAPFCDKIEIAGSIRRGRMFVNDIDLVVLPRAGQTNALRERCKRNSEVVTDGEQNLIVKLPGIDFQLDVFIARPASTELFEKKPSNWGTLLLCRTGSKEYNIFLATRAQKLGLHWKPYEGIFDDELLIASETEEEIFAALKLAFIPPAMRERT